MKERHPWSVDEELYVLQPLATSLDARETYLRDKKGYRETVAKNMNGFFGGNNCKYEKLDAKKVLAKFKHFAKRYREYLRSPDRS